MNSRLLVFGSTLLLAASSQAVDLYNNFGPGDTYRVGAGSTINANVSLAVPFTIHEDYKLEFIRLALFSFNEYTVSINSGGSTIPGSSIANWTVTGNGISTLTPSAPVNLSAGSYYLMVKHHSGTGGAWNSNNIGDIGPYSFTNTPDVWNAGAGERPVHLISATPVPEPASLFALGGLVLAVVRRKKRRS